MNTEMIFNLQMTMGLVFWLLVSFWFVLPALYKINFFDALTVPLLIAVLRFHGMNFLVAENNNGLSLNFATKIGGAVEIFVQPQVINVFNNQGKIAVNTTVRTSASPGGGTYAAFNPFTTVPTQGLSKSGANWDYGRVGACDAANPSAPGCALAFGNARNKDDYQQPRTFLATVGIRF